MNESSVTSFQSVYRQYRHKIYTYVYYRVNSDRDLAEDIVSDIFLKAYRAYHSYNHQYALSTWLYTIARNTLIDHYRRHKELVNIDDLENADKTDSLYLLIEKQITLEELQVAIDTLPEAQAQYIRQQFFEGYTAKEIAEDNNLSHAAVRKQVSRGIAALREKLLLVTIFICIIILQS